MKQVYRVKEVAIALSVSPSTIWCWVSEEKFPKPKKLGSKVTIWLKRDIDEFINNN